MKISIELLLLVALLAPKAHAEEVMIVLWNCEKYLSDHWPIVLTLEEMADDV